MEPMKPVLRPVMLLPLRSQASVPDFELGFWKQAFHKILQDCRINLRGGAKSPFGSAEHAVDLTTSLQRVVINRGHLYFEFPAERGGQALTFRVHFTYRGSALSFTAIEIYGGIVQHGDPARSLVVFRSSIIHAAQSECDMGRKADRVTSTFVKCCSGLETCISFEHPLSIYEEQFVKGLWMQALHAKDKLETVEMAFEEEIGALSDSEEVKSEDAVDAGSAGGEGLEAKIKELEAEKMRLEELAKTQADVSADALLWERRAREQRAICEKLREENEALRTENSILLDNHKAKHEEKNATTQTTSVDKIEVPKVIKSKGTTLRPEADKFHPAQNRAPISTFLGKENQQSVNLPATPPTMAPMYVKQEHPDTPTPMPKRHNGATNMLGIHSGPFAMDSFPHETKGKLLVDAKEGDGHPVVKQELKPSDELKALFTTFSDTFGNISNGEQANSTGAAATDMVKEEEEGKPSGAASIASSCEVLVKGQGPGHRGVLGQGNGGTTGGASTMEALAARISLLIK